VGEKLRETSVHELSQKKGGIYAVSLRPELENGGSEGKPASGVKSNRPREKGRGEGCWYYKSRLLLLEEKILPLGGMGGERKDWSASISGEKNEKGRRKKGI